MTEEQKKRKSESNKRLARQRRERGICSSCDNPVATHSANYCEEHLAAQRNYAVAKRKKFREVVFAAYGNACACCHEAEQAFLCIDHIEGNGRKHREEISRKAGWSFYFWLVRNDFPAGFQVLCFNCNNAKGIFGTCPHQTREKN